MSKKLLKLVVCLSLCSIPSLWRVLAVPPADIKVGYLVDQYFAIKAGVPEDPDEKKKYDGHSRLSDWEVDSKAGSTTYTYWNYLNIQHNSTPAPFEMRKPFLPQSAGTLGVEFRFDLPTKTDGMVWAVRANRTASLIEFTTQGGSFGYLLDGTTTFKPLITYTAKKAYTVHVDLDLSAAAATIYIDGVKYGTPVSITQNIKAGPASQFYVGTSAASTSAADAASGVNSMHLYYVTVVKGYKVLERFTNAAAGAVPADWTATASGTGASATVQAAHGSSSKDILSFQLNDTVGGATCTLGRTFAASTSKLVWEYKFMLRTAQDGVKMQLRSGSTNAVTIITTADHLFCLTDTADTPRQIWANYKPKVWYTVRVVADPAAHKADIYVNGKLKASQVTFNNSNASSLDGVAFTSSATTTGVVWIDDVLVYDLQPDALDYVPDIQTVTVSGDKKVGMQTFFAGWREGSHQGWDWVYRYPNHDPYLGFADGGNPEVMDWQLKWMAESGVNFFLDCWYKNPANGGVVYPMKEPLFEYTQGPLHSGYFYAKYSDKVKFAIADYSVQSLTAQQFQDNILPYWMEYYFNDPRYYVIPTTSAKKGYPVISFGTAVNWLQKPPAADSTALKNSIAALRAALVSAGFDDAVVLAEYRYADPTVLTALRDAGVNYVYAYWGENIVSSTDPNADTTQYRLGQQLTVGSGPNPPIVRPIPDGGQGYNGEAWDLSLDHAGWTSQGDFLAHSQWMKTTFPTLAGVSGQSLNTVLYDNWCEYGEGHFIAPTALAGFDYVDRIRNVFAGVPIPPPGQASPFHQIPTDAQKTRLNTLYARGWDGRNWGFDSLEPDTEGWAANAGITAGSLVQNHGYLEGTFSNTDPSIVSRDGYHIDGEVHNQIKMRMKKSVAGPAYARFYFTTNDAGDASHLTFDTEKSVQFPLNNDTNYQEYTVDMWTAPKWANSIRQLRFDPVDFGAVAGETFSIDYIRIVSPSNPGWTWGSSSLDGWTASAGISGFAASGGYVGGNIVGTDPYILSADRVSLNASAFKQVRVMMKNSTANTAAKLYFITETDGTYNEAKAKAITIKKIPEYTDYKEYTFDLSANPNWTGTIRQLRLDVVDSAQTGGSFSIDYILLAN